MSTAASAAAPDAAAPKKSKKKLLIVGVAVLLVLATAAYLVLGRGGSAQAAPPKPGEVVKLDPIQLNLRDGHYLRIGIALQATAKAKEAPEGSKALDATIALFSNRPMTDLAGSRAREKAKKELVEKVSEAYDHEVMDVYFTEFVMQ